MGDPAEENDPPPESRRSLAKGILSVNSKTKKIQSFTFLGHFKSSRDWRRDSSARTRKSAN